MSPREAFKAGFLLGCVDRGVDPAGAHALVKQALGAGAGKVLGEVVEAGGRGLASLVPTALNAGLLAAVGLPIAAGAGTGWAAAKLTDDDTNVDEAKSDEVLAELQRLTDQARRQAAVKALRGQSTLGAGG